MNSYDDTFLDDERVPAITAESLNEVYKALEDDVSRKIFNVRLQFAFDSVWHRFLGLGGPKSYPSHNFEAWYKKWNLPIVIFGTDGDGRYVAEFLRGQGYPLLAFCSNEDKYFYGEQQKLDGLPVWSFQELCHHSGECVIFLASSRFTSDMYEQCIYYFTNLNRDMIFYPANRRFIAYNPRQYFDFFEPEEHEVFVDGGAYNGFTTACFAEWAKKGYDMAYVFEANKKNERMIAEMMESHGIDKYKTIMKGTWDKEEKVLFDTMHSTAGCVTSYGDSYMEMTSIDKALLGNRVSFIKLDVEGSEAKTVLGAEETIRKWKPRLALSVYHRKEDFWLIPTLVKRILPEYKLAMRHYSSSNEETVLYAWI